MYVMLNYDLGWRPAPWGCSVQSGEGSSRCTLYKDAVPTKNCFIDKSRPCDLTCKAAFPVDDAVDPVDCFFIWMAGHLGDGVIDVRQFLEQRGFSGPPMTGHKSPKPEDPGFDASAN